MASTATPGAETSAHGIGSNHAVTVAIQPETQSAIPGLSDDVVVAEVLGRIKDPTDLARLRAVSRAMRDAVAATGHPVTEMGGNHAVVHGYLSTLKHLHRQGRLKLDKVLPRMRHWVGTSRCCSGRTRTGARGKRRRARLRRRAGILRCCSGRTRMAARGTRGRARGRRGAGTSRCCSGRARTAVHGTRKRALWRRWAFDNSSFCSGLARTAARGTR